MVAGDCWMVVLVVPCNLCKLNAHTAEINRLVTREDNETQQSAKAGKNIAYNPFGLGWRA